MLIFRSLITALLVIFLSACASKKPLESKDLPEAELYQKAQQSLDRNSYALAIEDLRLLESRFPFGNYAEQAQLELIYAQFQNLEQDAAKASADRFIRLHPNSEQADYAYYMRGLASYTADVGLMERYVEIDMSKRDPGQARNSFSEFSELITRFPDSLYAPDARQRMIFLRNQLAMSEIHVARYYLKREAYVAAANRGRYVMENMQGTPAVPLALGVMIESYQHLGLHQSADKALAVLRNSYPKHPLLDENNNFVGYHAFDDVDPSMWTILSFDLIGASKKVNVPTPPKSGSVQ